MIPVPRTLRVAPYRSNVSTWTSKSAQSSSRAAARASLTEVLLGEYDGLFEVFQRRSLGAFPCSIGPLRRGHALEPRDRFLLNGACGLDGGEPKPVHELAAELNSPKTRRLND